MAQQKALFLEKKGGAFVIGNTGVPSPDAGEVVVKVQAAALNPVDWKVQEYGWFYETWPAIMGLDVAGDVEAVGEGVEGFTKGDRVIFQATFRNEFAGFQQFTRVPAEIVGKFPAKLSYSEAASVPSGFITAAVGLFASRPAGTGLNPTFDRTIKYSGKPVLVIGGSSSVGQYAIQLLKFAGFSPIITYASEYHAKFLKTLGATAVIDRSSVPIDRLSSAVKAITSDPFEIVFDAIGVSETQNAGHAILADGGQMVATLPVEVAKPVENKRVFFVQGNVHLEFNRTFGKEIFKNLPSFLEEGVIVPNEVEDLPGGLAGIPDGLERLRNGDVHGKKLIARPQHTL